MNFARLLTICSLCLIATTTELSSHSLELSGMLAFSSPENAAIVISDRETKQVSPWLKAGGEWRGYHVVRINPVEETAVLKQNGVEFAILLRASRVLESAPIAVASAITPALLKGTSSVNDGIVTYSADAVIKIGELTLTAFKGVMTFDGATIRGDLSVEAEKSRFTAEDAMVEFRDGRPLVKGKSMRIVIRSSDTPTVPNGTSKPN